MRRSPLRRKTPLKAGGKRLRAKKPARGRPSTKEPEAARSKGHRDWLATQMCCLAGRLRKMEPAEGVGIIGHRCFGDVVAAHIRIGTRGGTGYKPNDGYCLPLCYQGHALDEHKGARSFAARWGIDPKALAIEYANRSPFRSELGDL